MALGLPPKYKGEIHLEPTDTHQQFLALAIETAKEAGWDIDFANQELVVFFTKNDIKWHARIDFQIEGRWAYVKSESAGGELFDWGKNKKNVDEFISIFNRLKKTVSPEKIEGKYEDMKSTLAAPGEEIHSRSDARKIKSFLYLFIPRGGYFVTPIILDLNILIFLLMVASGANFFHPGSGYMIKWGANVKPLVLNGQWWRLLTNCFIHFGIGHLLMNMLVLIYIGLLLEPRIGKVRFAVAYLFTGIAGSVTSLWWHSFAVSAGASGAIFGLFGIFLALLLTNVTEKEHRNAMLLSIGVFVLYNLVAGLKAGIDDSAHMGGLISGLVIGFSFYPVLVNPELKTRNTIIGSFGFATTTVVLALILAHTSDPVGRFAKLMQRFDYCENKALTFYRIPHSVPSKHLLHVVDADGIAYWKACEKLVNKMEAIPDLPAKLQARVSILKEYCHYRLIIFRMLDKEIRKDSKEYYVLITLYNGKIDILRDKLSGEKIHTHFLNYKIGSGLFPKLPKGFLYVVNGGPVLDSLIIRPDDIKSIMFLRPRPSYRLYGEMGRKGSFMIETKSPNIHSYKPGKVIP